MALRVPVILQRWLIAALLVVGLGGLAMGALRSYQERLRQLPSGPTAGGAATPSDMCRRGLPPDMVQACLAEQRRLSADTRHTALLWASMGVSCLLAAGILRRRLYRSGRTTVSAAPNIANS